MMALFRWTLVLLVALALAWVPIAVAAAQDAPAPDTIRPHTSTVYAITSLPCWQADPALLASRIRGHWRVENQLHWVRDVTFDEDRSQIRTAAGPQVMAALRNLALTALRLTSIPNIAAGLRHHARDRSGHWPPR